MHIAMLLCGSRGHGITVLATSNWLVSSESVFLTFCPDFKHKQMLMVHQTQVKWRENDAVSSLDKTQTVTVWTLERRHTGEKKSRLLA